MGEKEPLNTFSKCFSTSEQISSGEFSTSPEEVLKLNSVLFKD